MTVRDLVVLLHAKPEWGHLEVILEQTAPDGSCRVVELEGGEPIVIRENGTSRSWLRLWGREAAR